MRALELKDEEDAYRVVIRQGLATIHDGSGTLVRVHRIDGGKLPPSPGDRLMQLLLEAIRATEGGAEYLGACASVRVARESALADPASKWRDYENTWLAAREVRESWEDGHYIPRTSVPPSGAVSTPHPGARLPRSSIRRRLVAWGQR